MTEARRRALAGFLRAHRARITPAEAGIEPGVRRRTPGLRREEVALLAGVGVTWYTWLEQGRDIHPSAEVLGAIARVLRLSPAERDYLFRLAGHEPPSTAPRPDEPPDALLRFLYAQDPVPALVQDAWWDVRAWNAGAEALYAFSRHPVADRNLAWLMFAAPEMRDRLTGWEGHARRMMGELRDTFARLPDDRRLAALMHRLRTAFPESAPWLDAGEVNARTGAVAKEMHHPAAGPLHLDQLVFRPADAPALTVVVLQPAGPDTAARLAALAPGAVTAP